MALKLDTREPTIAGIVPEPDPIEEVGYSVQTWIGRSVKNTINLGSNDPTYHCWLSTDFNAIPPVGPSSNPAAIFAEIDSAIKTNDDAAPKIERIRQKLVAAIARTIGVRDVLEGHRIAQAVWDAELSKFRPEVWRISLVNVALDRRQTGSFPNEMLITDLRPDEFSVVIP